MILVIYCVNSLTCASVSAWCQNLSCFRFQRTAKWHQETVAERPRVRRKRRKKRV